MVDEKGENKGENKKGVGNGQGAKIDGETAKKDETAGASRIKVSGKLTKIIEEIGKLSVLELAELVGALEEKFGVSAAPVVVAGGASGGGLAPATAGTGGAPVEEQTNFNVVLADAGANKIGVIKTLREINQQLGLKEAKDLTEKPGSMILEGANKTSAEEAKKKLEAVGAKVELK